MQLDPRHFKILQEMGIPMSGFALRQKVAQKSLADRDLAPPKAQIPIKIADPTGGSFASTHYPTQTLSTPGNPHNPNTGTMARATTPTNTTTLARKANPASQAKSDYLPTDSSLLQTLDGKELQETASTCQGCALSKTRHRVVWGSHIEVNSSKSSPPKSLDLAKVENLDWLIVDYSPTDLEDQTANPFASESGQLLMNMLKALRSQDSAPWVTQQAFSEAKALVRSIALINAVKCHPPGGRNPDEFEVSQCRPYLQRQIELLRPKVILLLGIQTYKAVFGNPGAAPIQTSNSGASAESYTNNKTPPLTQLRGEVLRLRETPTFVTYHPGSLLLHPQDKAKAWQDLTRAHSYLVAQEVALLEAASKPK